MHTKEICTFYDNITLALISACNESIPFTKPTRGKSMPGWNDYVRKILEPHCFGTIYGLITDVQLRG